MYWRQLTDITVHEKVGTVSINQMKEQIADYNYTFLRISSPGGLPHKKDGFAGREF